MNLWVTLEKYYLNRSNILLFSSLLKEKSNNNYCINKIKANNNINNKNLYFIPDEEDKLFWCFYIFLNGKEQYNMNNLSSFSIEKAFKINAIEQIRLNKDIYKKNKLKLVDIENELGSENKIGFIGLYALCILYKINIIYLWDKRYFELFGDKQNPEIHYIKIYNNDHSIYNSPYQYDYYSSNYWKIDNMKKPLKSLSAYSSKNLQNICDKLKIPYITELGKNKTKKELYQDIIKCL